MKFSKILALTGLGVVSLANAAGEKQGLIHVSKFSADLDSAKKNLFVNLDFEALDDACDVDVAMVLSLAGLRIEHVNFDVCQFLDRAQSAFSDSTAPCSIVRGDRYSIQISHEMRSLIPDNMPLSVDVLANEELSHSGEFVSGSTDIVSPALQAFLRTEPSYQFSDDEIDTLFSRWVTQFAEDIHIPERSSLKENNLQLHSINYANVESRKGIFAENLKKILHHNANTKSYKMGVNQFAHLTSDEFKRIFASSYIPAIKRSSKHVGDDRMQRADKASLVKRQGIFHHFFAPDSSLFESSRNLRVSDVPEEVNWVEGGAVTEVKNQGACGSCWSFATTGALEGAYFKKYGKLISFSEQELVSCDHEDLGCNGGSMDQAYQVIDELGGLCKESDYPYTSGNGVRGFCQVDPTHQNASMVSICENVPGSAPKKFVDVEHTEQSLMAAVAQQPVAVAIEADEAAFQFYSSGVLDATCSQSLDHGVLVVGYSHEVNAVTGVDEPYWLIKNSWGAQWGENGYIKILKGALEDEGGECGVLLSPSYPEV